MSAGYLPVLGLKVTSFMNHGQLQEIKQWFRSYARTFIVSDGDNCSFYQLKMEHSQRVAVEMRLLGEALHWEATEVNLGEAIGWLHDIGRFAQYHQFGTFCDAHSLNHGEFGCELLLEEERLSALTSDEQVAILEAVRYHNAMSLPGHLKGTPLRMAKLIRDADKLDIFHIVREALAKDGFQDLPRMLPLVKLEGSISLKIIGCVLRECACSMQEVTSLGDFLLLQLSWVYDINYLPTFQQVVQRNILSNLAEWLPRNNGVIEALLNTAEAYVSNQIGEGQACYDNDKVLTKRLRQAFHSMKASADLKHVIRASIDHAS